MITKFIYSIAITILVFDCSCNNNATNTNASIAINNNTTASNQKKIKLKWLAQWYSEGKKETFIREIARDFSFKHQNIEIELEFPHQMAKTDVNSAFFPTVDTIKKMALQNKWPYDMMLCDAYIYQQVGDSIKNREWGKEYLVNFINEPWYKNAHKDNVVGTKKSNEIFKGIAPGAFIEGVWNLLYVSEFVEAKIGIKVKRQNMTMSDYISYAKAVYQYNQSHSDKITFFSSPIIQTSSFYNHLMLSAFDKDTTYTKEEAINALKLVYAALDKLAAYKPIDTYFTYKDSKFLYQDKALFVYCASWIDLIWQHSNPEGEKMMHLCEIPSIDSKQAIDYSGIYNSIFVIPKNAKNREAAILLMKYICSEEIAEKWLKYSKCPTGLKSKISYNDFGTDEFTKFSQHINKKYNDRLTDADQISLRFNSNIPLNYQFENVLRGLISSQDAFNSTIKQLKAD